MRKHLIALLVITPLLLSSQLSTSHAAAKSGAKCSKVGSKSVVGAKTFTCIKSGTKLIWDKGVQVTTTTKESAQSLYYERFKKTGSKGLKMFDEWRSNPASGKPKSKIEYWFGSSVPSDIVIESKRRLDNAVLQWERFHKVTRTKIYLDLSMKDQIMEQCRVMAPRSEYFPLDWCRSQLEQSLSSFIYHAAAYESEGSWRPILAPKLTATASVTHAYVLLEPRMFLTDSFFPRIEHEWFHQIQFDLSGNHYIRENPVWFMEGSAEYF
jgi:hypothetical protein